MQGFEKPQLQTWNNSASRVANLTLMPHSFPPLHTQPAGGDENRFTISNIELRPIEHKMS